MILLFSWFYRGRLWSRALNPSHSNCGVRIRTQSNPQNTVLAIILSPVESCPRSHVFNRDHSLNGLTDTDLYLQLHLVYFWSWVLSPLLKMCSLSLPQTPANQGNLSHPSKLILKSKVHFLKQSSRNSQKWINFSSIFHSTMCLKCSAYIKGLMPYF